MNSWRPAMKTERFSLRDPVRGQALTQALRRFAPDNPVRIVHVCGTHEITISEHGLRHVLPDNVSVLEGPGCPVCVTSTVDLDRAVRLAEQEVAVCTFGDMMRVPGSRMTLDEARALGAPVHTVLSAADAVTLARRNPTREVVFFAVGFETTAPGTAAVVLEDPPDNFSVLCSHKLIPPAVERLVEMPGTDLDGLLAPGHVSTVIGAEAYAELARRHRIPVVVGGFEPLDVLYALALLLKQLAEGRTEVENAYLRAVSWEGNPRARDLLEQAFQVCDARWRGIGEIPSSGLAVRGELAHLDASLKYDIPAEEGQEVVPGCRCADVLVARAVPSDCPLFGGECTPLTPVGPCMVGAEGACAVWHRHGERPVL
ncbi:MAG: hydrogenase formation protein HypD [Candidatus Bipolaricaulota bacterium]